MTQKGRKIAYNCQENKKRTINKDKINTNHIQSTIRTSYLLMIIIANFQS